MDALSKKCDVFSHDPCVLFENHAAFSFHVKASPLLPVPLAIAGMLVAGLMVWLFGVMIDSIASNRGHDQALGNDFQTGLLVLSGIMLMAVVLHLLVREPKNPASQDASLEVHVSKR